MGFWQNLLVNIKAFFYDVKISKEAVFDLINAVDINKDGYISVKELIKYLKTYLKFRR